MTSARWKLSFLHFSTTFSYILVVGSFYFTCHLIYGIKETCSWQTQCDISLAIEKAVFQICFQHFCPSIYNHERIQLTSTLYIFPSCYRLYVALATLTEPHQLTATLNCVTSVARALVRPDESYPAGRHHVLPLLQLVLPGIDPNDFRKALVSLYSVNNVVYAFRLSPSCVLKLVSAMWYFLSLGHNVAKIFFFSFHREHLCLYLLLSVSFLWLIVQKLWEL